MIIIDIEASGLHERSYPIEVAWCDRDDPSQFDSFLINPPRGWDYWDWDIHAERKIHKIPRTLLRAEGISVDEAAARLNQRLAGCEVYSDAVEYDYRWLRTLFDMARSTMDFQVCCMYRLLDTSKRNAYLACFREKPAEHRALADVRQIIGCLDRVL